MKLPRPRPSLYAAIGQLIDEQTRLYPQLATGPLATWTPEMETHVFVDPSVVAHDEDGAELAPDALDLRQIRIPHRVSSDPRHSDYELDPDAIQYWTRIGTSGWNWIRKQTHWVGYDIDSTDGHTCGLDDETLTRTIRAALRLDYASVRTSKSGNGYHVLVHLTSPYSTPTSRDHRRLATGILDRMSRDAGYDFAPHVDTTGQILWHWARDLPPHALQPVHSI